jgi:stage II sporulation protein D
LKKIVPYVLISLAIFTIIIVLPATLVSFFDDGKAIVKSEKEKKKISIDYENQIVVSVFRTQKNRVEEVPLEEYVTGVVATEMPANFELEALKAQALTARTNIILSKINGLNSKDSDVSDTTKDQVYKNKEELKTVWGKDFSWKYKKVSDAVEATKGEILTYNEKPITASFFSTSNGRTENSEEYWSTAMPYLRSVDSPWDLNSPKYQNRISVSVTDFEKKLNIKLPNSKNVGTIKKKTSGGRIAEFIISGKTFTGREIREKLGLKSTDFSMSRNGAEIVIDTKGYGHGVGMSQYGANGLASQGKKYLDIINHYYQGVQISKLDSMDAVAVLMK